MTATICRKLISQNFQIFFLQMEPLEFVKVRLEMIQSRDDTALAPMQFRIGPVMLNGIGSIDRASKLLPNASFIAKWSLKPVKNMRLIREVEYQVCHQISK